MLVFFAAAYQMFIVNESIYRSLTAVHSLLMRDGFEHNCYEAKPDCWHDTDKHAHIIWRERDGSGTPVIPEIRIIAVKMFQPFGLTKSVLIQSNVRGAEPSKGCNVPCKKTKMGAGAGGPSQYYTKSISRPFDFSAYCCSDHSLYGKAFWAAQQIPTSEWINAFQPRLGF